MSWSHHRRGKRGYHHGNLREALIKAALSLIGERGSEGVTLAEAARMAGVSAAAPYRHFKDREALMAAVAGEGYAKFADMLEQAWNDGAPDAIAALERVGSAYLAFAREEPALYAAMFESSVALGTDNLTGFLGRFRHCLMIGLGIVAGVLAVIPFELELVATLDCLPGVVGNNRYTTQRREL